MAAQDVPKLQLATAPLLCKNPSIEEIIEWFKRGMHPNTRGYSGATPLLGFPDVWTIEPEPEPRVTCALRCVV